MDSASDSTSDSHRTVEDPRLEHIQRGISTLRALKARLQTDALILDERGFPMCLVGRPGREEEPSGDLWFQRETMVMGFQAIKKLNAVPWLLGQLSDFNAMWVMAGHGPGPLGVGFDQSYSRFVFSDRALQVRRRFGLDGMDYPRQVMQ